jgi:hypothetical protein
MCAFRKLEIYGHFLAEEVVRGEDAAGLDGGEIGALREHLEGSGIAEDQRARGGVDWLELNGHLGVERAEEMRASGQLDIDAGDFAKTDLPVGFAVVLPLVFLAAIKDNRRALSVYRRKSGKVWGRENAWSGLRWRSGRCGKLGRTT